MPNPTAWGATPAPAAGGYNPVAPPAERSPVSALPPSVPVPLHELPDGTLRVVGTRVPLDTVLHAHRSGDPPEAIHDSFPTVSLADVYACLAYYHRHRAEADAYLARRAVEAERMVRWIEATFPQDGFRERLLARQRAQPGGP